MKLRNLAKIVFPQIEVRGYGSQTTVNVDDTNYGIGNGNGETYPMDSIGNLLGGIGGDIGATPGGYILRPSINPLFDRTNETNGTYGVKGTNTWSDTLIVYLNMSGAFAAGFTVNIYGGYSAQGNATDLLMLTSPAFTDAGIYQMRIGPREPTIPGFSTTDQAPHTFWITTTHSDTGSYKLLAIPG